MVVKDYDTKAEKLKQKILESEEKRAYFSPRF